MAANAVGLDAPVSVDSSRSRESANVAPMLPVLAMSTVPVCGAPPGTMSAGLKIAASSRELSMVSVPAVNVLLGLALRLVKSAPDPTATPAAASAVASAATVRRGRAASPWIIVIDETPLSGCTAATVRPESAAAPVRRRGRAGWGMG